MLSAITGEGGGRLDTRLVRAHDHPNLYVMGSAVFPTSGTANPTLTIAALALRLAERIKGELADR